SAAMLGRPAVAGVIIGARNRDHLPRNLAIGALRLTDADRAGIEAALAEGRVPEGDTYTLERDRHGRHGQIIKYNLNAEASAISRPARPRRDGTPTRARTRHPNREDDAMRRILLASAAALALTPGLAAACEITVGLVLELTGPAGEYGQASAKSVEMAFRDLNEAGGVAGCTLKTDTRDSQTQANVAVDAATQLVQVEKVPAIIGGVIS